MSYGVCARVRKRDAMHMSVPVDEVCVYYGYYLFKYQAHKEHHVIFLTLGTMIMCNEVCLGSYNAAHHT